MLYIFLKTVFMIMLVLAQIRLKNTSLRSLNIFFSFGLGNEIKIVIKTKRRTHFMSVNLLKR